MVPDSFLAAREGYREGLGPHTFLARFLPSPRQSFVRTLALVLSLLAAAGLCAGSQADKLYKQGRKAEKAGEIARAYILYTQAAALEPARTIYALRAQALQSRAAMQAKSVPQKKPCLLYTSPSPRDS